MSSATIYSVTASRVCSGIMSVVTFPMTVDNKYPNPWVVIRQTVKDEFGNQWDAIRHCTWNAEQEGWIF